MFDWLGALVKQVIAAVFAGSLAVSPVVMERSPSVSNTQELGDEVVAENIATTSERMAEIDLLRAALAEEKEARLKLEERFGASLKPSTQGVAPKPPAAPVNVASQSLPDRKVEKKAKTFTTPSGAVLDEAGNIVAGPTQPTPAASSPVATAGSRELTGEEVYSIVAPSVVLVTTTDSYGSGFVMPGGKYTMTNAHVVGDDEKVSLRFQNGKTVTGVVLGKDTSRDVAVIYHGNVGVPAVKFGSSSSVSLKTGADVYALGYPLEFKTTITLTKGLVSANRQQTVSGIYIQTDAAIHPGNSGGPLVNSRGEVVGINTLGKTSVSSSGQDIGGTGIGFAVPIETANSVVPSLTNNGNNRIEKYPPGSTLTIGRRMLVKIEYNEELTCSQLGIVGDEAVICDLYTNHHSEYQWIVSENL